MVASPSIFPFVSRVVSRNDCSRVPTNTRFLPAPYSGNSIVRPSLPLYTSWRHELVSKKATGGHAAMINSQAVHSEKSLIASARAGNRTAFGELVRRHSRRVYGMSMKILRNREDAEDNLQNVFCKAYGKIQQFQGSSQLSTWLIRIAINEALMMLRKRRPEEASVTADEGGGLDDLETNSELRDLRADPERQYLTKELATKALDVLHPTLKYAFILQKGEGWTSRELAKALDITPELVKSRVFRARVKLRQRLLALAKPETMALQGQNG
jgi:RNA polymerase sigma-70 factor (ECF subfamily)